MDITFGIFFIISIVASIYLSMHALNISSPSEREEKVSKLLKLWVILNCDIIVMNNFSLLLAFIPFLSLIKIGVYIMLVFFPEQPAVDYIYEKCVVRAVSIIEYYTFDPAKRLIVKFLIGTYVMFVNLFASSLKFLSQTKSIERLSSLRKTVANSQYGNDEMKANADQKTD